MAKVWEKFTVRFRAIFKFSFCFGGAFGGAWEDYRWCSCVCVYGSFSYQREAQPMICSYCDGGGAYYDEGGESVNTGCGIIFKSLYISYLLLLFF